MLLGSMFALRSTNSLFLSTIQIRRRLDSSIPTPIPATIPKGDGGESPDAHGEESTEGDGGESPDAHGEESTEGDGGESPDPNGGGTPAAHGGNLLTFCRGRGSNPHALSDTRS